MTRPLTTLSFLCIIAVHGFGQDLKSGDGRPSADSVLNKINDKSQSIQDSLQHKLGLSKMDSLAQKANGKIQTLQGSIPGKWDSLRQLGNVQRFKDSLNIQGWGSSMKERVTAKMSLDSLGFTRSMDSLRRLNLSPSQYTRKLDSLKERKAAMVKEVSAKQQELQQKVTKRYHSWETSVRNKFKLDSIGVKLPGEKLGNFTGNIKDPLNAPGMPNVNTGLPGIPGIPALSDNDFSDLGLSPDLVNAGGTFSVPSMDQLKQWEQSIPTVGGIQGQMKEVTQMLKDPSTGIESAVGNIGAVSDVSKQIAQAEQLKQQNEALQIADKMKDAGTMKEEGRTMATQEAMNHFKGQEASLQKAMDQMAKYKKKYASLHDLSQVKKNDWLPHNGLKGHPFRERFRTGLHLGVRNMKDTLAIDFYPNVSYKITGRIEMGAGMIYRVREVKNNWSMDQRNPGWGFAGFGIVKTFRSTYFRVEADVNSKSKSVALDAPPQREWRWSFLAGTQTNFKISQTLSGNIQLLFNFDKNLKDVFPEALTMRFGVQYKLKTKNLKLKTKNRELRT